MSLVIQDSIDGMRFGHHGLWTTFTHTRNCILLATPDIVRSMTGKMRTKFPYALHSPKLENALAVLTLHCCPSGMVAIASRYMCTKDVRFDSCRSAYAPRAMWSNLHACPADAVQIFKDVR